MKNRADVTEFSIVLRVVAEEYEDGSVTVTADGVRGVTGQALPTPWDDDEQTRLPPEFEDYIRVRLQEIRALDYAEDYGDTGGEPDEPF